MRGDYLRGQLRAARLRAAVAFVAGVGTTVLAAGGGLGPVAGAAPPFGAIAAAALLVAPWLAFVVAWRAAGRAARFRAGAQGEDALEQVLSRRLGDEWTLYRNLRLPGAGGDLDAVLLGPPGLVLLENKAYRGEFVLFGDRWYRTAGRDGLDLRAWRGSPSAQAVRAGERLGDWLAVHDPDLARVPLHPLVVLSSGRVREERIASPVPVVSLARLPDHLAALPRARGLNRERRAVLAAALDTLNSPEG